MLVSFVVSGFVLLFLGPVAKSLYEEPPGIAREGHDAFADKGLAGLGIGRKSREDIFPTGRSGLKELDVLRNVDLEGGGKRRPGKPNRGQNMSVYVRFVFD